MTDPDVQIGRTHTVRLVPSAPMVTPEATVYDRARTVIATPTPTASAVSTTVATATARDRFTVASATGIAVGLSVRVSGVWGQAITRVVQVDGVSLRVSPALPEVPAVGATVRGLDILVTVGPHTEPYMGYVLEVVDAGSSTPSVRCTYNAVVYPYVGPCTPEHVRDLLAGSFAGERAKIGDTIFHERVAEEVNEAIRGRLLESATYLSDYWAPSALTAARAAMLRLVLGESHGLRESGSTRDDYLSGLRFEVRDRINGLLKSAELYSKTQDGKVADADVGLAVTSVEWRR